MSDSTQYERDLRSANKEWRRGKDSNVKWAHGSRYLAGIELKIDGQFGNGATAPDHMFAKSRPNKRPSEANHLPKTSQNIIKTRSAYTMPAARRRAKMHCQTEIEAATSPSSAAFDLPRGSILPTLAAATPPADADVLYSFDRTDTPGRPLTLEVFVKNTTGRDTERLVEREYEVLDGNGDAVRGRRARAVLRRGPSKERDGAGGEVEEEDVREVEGGFELV
ncbi:predicted protein [Chaetomium globosum CBS 148.51]|uniref:Uncharacterized protein n=1 Tax=Chaetomium globosum (strain ATCC 6205 / CBS 148.51 / DSM 1962 / NBRC 6347 / NRRL 1970) TaxID=306901 RepID=Q2H0A9_CHAGB|nr:uncharacterized protein CHGG_04787 [Chaetomium globosum CBS 148.51]EAQ88168.1 predicted protein [Chaetomium globosum CBS 148.51]